jgi:hypothetical protein
LAKITKGNIGRETENPKARGTAVPVTKQPEMLNFKQFLNGKEGESIDVSNYNTSTTEKISKEMQSKNLNFKF